MRLAPNPETAVFRVAQIALTHVARHSHATYVRVELLREDRAVMLIVSDNGTGFDVQGAFERASHGGTLGLLSMQERVRLAGGELEIRSETGRGSEVRARFSLNEGRERLG